MSCCGSALGWSSLRAHGCAFVTQTARYRSSCHDAYGLGLGALVFRDRESRGASLSIECSRFATGEYALNAVIGCCAFCFSGLEVEVTRYSVDWYMTATTDIGTAKGCCC